VEVLIGLLVLGLLALAVVGPVLSLVAFSRTSRLRAQIEALEVRLAALTKAVPSGVAPAADTVRAAAPAPEPPVARVAQAPPSPAPAPVAFPSAAASPAGPAPVPRRVEAPPPPPPRAPAPPPMPPRAGGDFATNLGPKILVAAGALAFVVFLGLFVKYAWENNWVGPTGRVLLGAAMGVALVAGGVRLMGREYRPLGQGLAAAGLAGLYVSAFGAHAFYGLIPRGAAGALLVVITVNAVLLAMRLDARLLASLAWVGGYLTPLLLSTGEDKAVALFAYLALLDAGAIALDRRKPWPETVPLAMAGTLVLYAGWYATFFRPERFEVAASGLVLFTALFALGMARKERGAGLGFVLSVAALGVAVLAAGADRPAILLVLSFGLAGAALRMATGRGRWLSFIAMLAVALPYMTWSAAHYRPEGFGIAAAWVTGGVLMLVGTSALGRGPTAIPLEPLALVGGGLASVGLAAATDRPMLILPFLLALAGVAVLAQRRWAWAEAAGVITAAMAVLSWLDRFYKPDRAAEALTLALTVAGGYLVALVARGFLMRQRIGAPGIVGHLATAGLAWTVLYRVLEGPRPSTLGLACLGLAVLYLAIGLVALRERHEDKAQARVILGLSAAFLTLAIPVQLGLHGITLAWALEGLLLLGLGVRFGSALARVGGYGVMGLAVLRLFARHLPLHEAAFRPFGNPAFGTWLAVIVLLAVAVRLARDARRSPRSLDHALRLLTAMAAVVLLFGLLTAETQQTFAQRATLARATGDAAAAEAARLAGGLAVSVLWTAFATGLLAAGLGVRSRALFYSGYALFAVTSAKVVMWDLATLETVYRMLSFLALAALLLAGAYLNLRFRQRLLPEAAAP
jgi:uncharacterized membrane protein